MYEALVATIATYIDLLPRDEALLRRLFGRRHLAQGEHFLLAGEVCHEVAYVSSGLIRYYINEDGDARAYSFSAEHEFVCDYSSFLVAQPSQHNVGARYAAPTSRP